MQNGPVRVRQLGAIATEFLNNAIDPRCFAVVLAAIVLFSCKLRPNKIVLSRHANFQVHINTSAL
jgi:hypothetical protein